MQTKESRTFIKDSDNSWETVGMGVRRKIIAYDKNVMMVRVHFETGAIGTVHQHPHVQLSQIESGVFEVEISGKKEILKTGDAFHVPSNEWHGVVCLEAGVLLDVFSPVREDFLS